MVLETNPVYDAIQICSENGYMVMAEWFVPIAIGIIFIVGACVGFYAGYKLLIKGIEDES